MPFTEELWSSITHVYDQIIHHPFNEELMKGTLAKERFKFYMQQDALYLFDFGKSLALMGARADSPGYLQQFAKFAEGAVVVESALHDQYFEKFGISGKASKSPTCMNYTSFLLATAATASYEKSMAALLPCFWIYKEVGDYIYENAASNNFYQEWIDTYSGEDFAELVEKAKNITNELADEASHKNKQAMKEAFIYSSKLEWMFWDSAYQQESWPV